MSKFKFIYDEEADSLVVYREDRKTSASIQLGEIIVSLDSDFRVTAVEILNPDVLYRIEKEKLSRISSASIQVQERGQIVWIYIILSFGTEEEPETLPVQLQLEKPLSV